MDHITRARWGARPWATAVHTVPMSQRTEVLVHYHGGPPRHATGVEVPREVDAIHRGNGWAGVGYNWLVDQAGAIFEGRGWDLVGAHCPDHNRTGIGIYVAIGGDQRPTDAALAAVRDVYDEACRLAGHELRRSWHGANYATACPGIPLIGWVRSGMPRPTGGRLPRPPVAVPASTGPRLVLRRVLRVVSPMLHGSDVEAVQRIVGAHDDGWYGSATRADVIRWQRAHGLDDDGVVGPATVRAMGGTWAGPVSA